MRHTPDLINFLERGEIFVFGSNTAGRHGAGAAKNAMDWFGAKYGVGEGLTGRCYAFPTLDDHFQRLPRARLVLAKYKFYTTVLGNPELTFLLTKIGCGLGGYSEEYMRSLFFGKKPTNIVFPRGW